MHDVNLGVPVDIRMRLCRVIDVKVHPQIYPVFWRLLMFHPLGSEFYLLLDWIIIYPSLDSSSSHPCCPHFSVY